MTILDPGEVVKFIESYDKQARALKEESLKICWFMRGGVTLSEDYDLDHKDREIIGKIIESNLETTKESGLPFF